MLEQTVTAFHEHTFGMTQAPGTTVAVLLVVVVMLLVMVVLLGVEVVYLLFCWWSWSCCWYLC
jgi:hypothetical protein